MCMLLTAISCAGNSQTATDTLCFPVEVIQQRLIEAKQGRELKKLVDVLRNDVSILSVEIEKFEKAIKELQDKNEKSEQIIAALNLNIQTMKDQRNILQTEIDRVTKELKKQKRKTTFTAIAGVAGIVLTGYLLK